MDTNAKQEGQVALEERGKATSVTEGTAATSKGNDQASAGAVKTESKTEKAVIDFKSPEFQEAVRNVAYDLAKSMKDKELTPLREKLKGYEDKEAEAEAERQLKKEAEEWEADGAEPQDIRSIQDAHRKNIADRKEIMKLAAEHQALLDRAARAEAILDLAESLGFNLPQDKIDYLIKESGGSKEPEVSSKLRKLLAAQIAAELKKTMEKKGETEESPERPDSSAHTAPGGVDIKSMKPIDKIDYGLKQERQRH